MGIEGISTGSLLLIFLIIVMLFGTKRLREAGEDLAAAVRGFKRGMAQIDHTQTNEADHPPVHHDEKV